MTSTSTSRKCSGPAEMNRSINSEKSSESLQPTRFTENILHQKDGDGINAYSHSDHTQRPKAHSQGAESCKVVDDSGQNAKAKPQPVDERSWGQATDVDLFGCLDSYVRSRARQGSNGGRLESC